MTLTTSSELREKSNMATIDIHNLSGEKVGTLELADEVFGAVNEDLLWEAVKHYRAGATGRHARHQEQEAGLRLGQEALEAEGHGPRAHRFDPVATVAAWRHGARTATALLRLRVSRARSCWARCVRRWREVGRRQADGGEAFEVKEPKTKSSARRWTALKVDGTALLVEAPKHENHNLGLSSRNIAGC